MVAIRSTTGAKVDSSAAAGSSPTALVTSVDTPTSANASAPRTTSSAVASAGKSAKHRGDLDLVGVAADGVAVAAQHVDLVGDLVGSAEDVARVGVLRDEAERLPLAAPADHDPRPRAAHRLGAADRLLELVVPTAVRAVVVAPHLQADLDRLLESLEPLGRRRERARRGRGARARTTPHRCRARRAPATRRRAWSSSWPAVPGWR